MSQYCIDIRPAAAAAMNIISSIFDHYANPTTSAMTLFGIVKGNAITSLIVLARNRNNGLLATLCFYSRKRFAN